MEFSRSIPSSVASDITTFIWYFGNTKLVPNKMYYLLPMLAGSWERFFALQEGIPLGAWLHMETMNRVKWHLQRNCNTINKIINLVSSKSSTRTSYWDILQKSNFTDAWCMHNNDVISPTSELSFPIQKPHQFVMLVCCCFLLAWQINHLEPLKSKTKKHL